MILVKKISKQNLKVETKRIYINTLAPKFKFKNKYGKTIMPMRNSVKL